MSTKSKLCCLLNPKYQCTVCEAILCSGELVPELWDEKGLTCNHGHLRDYPMTGMTYSRLRRSPKI